MSKLYLKPNPTIQDFQAYIKEMKAERGFNQTDTIFECVCLTEELGELAAAVKRTSKETKSKLDISKPIPTIDDVKEEIADVLIYLLSIANIYNIDVEEAFRQKEEKNKQRVWKKA